MDRKHLSLAAAILAAVLAQAGAAAPVRAEREHCGPITSNETWTAASNPHFVKCTVTIRNSTVTIAPGAIVLLNEGVDIVVQAGANLMAVGDPQVGSVAFRANSPDEQPGFWGQIRFESGAEPSRLNLVVASGGGRDGKATIEVQDAVAEVSGSQIRQSGGPALGFWANSLGPSLDAAGQATTGYECKGDPHPLLILDRDATIAVTGGDHHVVDSATWHHFCVPYVVKGDLVVAGADEPSLELDRGATLQFEPTGSLIVGLSDALPGQLQTSGSLDQPVLLTGQEDRPGAWRGVVLSAFSRFNNLLTTTIANGGADGTAMVQVLNDESSALDTHFRAALGYPVAATANGVGRFLIGAVGQETPAFVANGIQRVLVLTDPAGEDVTVPAAEWPDPGVPYELDGTLTIGNKGRPARLAVQAGATLLFDGDEALEVAEGGSLVAKGGLLGGKGVPATFTSANRSPGAWRGIVVRDGADVVQLDLATVEFGGAGGGAMLAWGDADGTVTRTTFRGAPAYPVSIPLSVAPDVIMGADQIAEGQDLRNHFEDNGQNRVLVHVNGPVTSAKLKDWADPGAPIEFDGSVVAASAAGPRLLWHDGLDLRFRAGASFQLSAPSQKGNVEVADDDPDLPVALGPADPASGWGGFRLLAGATLKGTDLSVAGALAGSANMLVDGGNVDMAGLRMRGNGQGIGLDATGPANVVLTASDFEGLDTGILTRNGARLDISKSVVKGNTAWGIRNEDPTRCQRALQVWWGMPSGPQDASSARDGCMNATNVSPGADKVSDDVEWWPYAINDTDFEASSGIGPNAKRLFLPRALK
jgi:hypothetical protein